MTGLRTGTKITLGILAGVVVAAFAVRSGVVWRYERKVKAEIAQFEAEGGSVRLADLAPKATLPDGTKRRFYKPEDFPYSYPRAQREVLSKLSSEESAKLLRDANTARAIEEWPGFDVNRSTVGRASRWRGDWTPFIERHLAENKRAVDAIKAAADEGTGAFAVDWNKTPLVKLDRIWTLRELAMLLRMESALAAHKGDTKSALEEVRLILRLRRLTDDEPLLYSKISGTWTDFLAMSALNGVLELAPPDRAGIEKVIAELADHEERNRTTRAMLGETASAIQLFKVVRRNPALWRLADYSYLKELGPSQPSSREVALGQLLKLVWIGSADEYHFLADMRALRAYTRQALPRGPVPAVTPWFTPSLKVLTTFVTSMTVPATARFVTQEERGDAYIRLGRTVLALSLYRADTGAYPVSLSTLVPKYLPAVPLDPYDGQPLRYKPNGGGFALYAIGQDRTDSSGVPYNDDLWERGK